MTKYICSIDRQTSIVMRNKRAVQLGYLQFRIFRLLHEAPTRDKKMLGSVVYEHIYNGTKDPAGRNCIAAMCSQMNRKLKHLGLKVQGTNRNKYSFFQIVVL